MSFEKINIKIITIGHIPFEFKKSKINKLKSKLFEISEPIDSYNTLDRNSDGEDWEYTDEQLRESIPNNFSEDFLIAVVNTPIEQNYYLRELSEKVFVLSFHEVTDILEYDNIPIENFLYRILYAMSLAYMGAKENKNFTMHDIERKLIHDETKGCLFDMTGIKYEVIHSAVEPIICRECQSTLSELKVPENYIKECLKECLRIRKGFYYRIIEFIKKYPILFLIITSIFAISLGIIGSLLASFIWSKL